VVLAVAVVVAVVAGALVMARRRPSDVGHPTAPPGEPRAASHQPGQGRPAGPGAEPMGTAGPGAPTPDPDADVDGRGGGSGGSA